MTQFTGVLTVVKLPTKWQNWDPNVRSEDLKQVSVCQQQLLPSGYPRPQQKQWSA
jgi:hypothetical protein